MHHSPVVDYCTEEVERQGHDNTRLDGIQRVGWMLDAWAFALIMSDGQWQTGTDRLEHVRMIGMKVEPRKNENGFRTCGVRVGGHVAPEPERVVPMLTRLLENHHTLTPLEFYKEFEYIHPFVDGNGRSGKVLLNWKNGTLHNPVWPPHDLFGAWVPNP